MNQQLDPVQTKEQNHELLKKYGHAWAVLAAWCIDFENQKKVIPHEAHLILEKISVQIKSGCYSACEVGCLMTNILSALTPASASVGDKFFDDWMNLYLQAMDGTMNYEQLVSIPALKPILSSYGFLRCTCGR